MSTGDDLEQSEDRKARKKGKGVVPKPSRRLRSRSRGAERYGAAYFWGGWIGVLMEFLTLKRVRRSIQESRRRRAERRGVGARRRE